MSIGTLCLIYFDQGILIDDVAPLEIKTDEDFSISRDASKTCGQ